MAVVERLLTAEEFFLLPEPPEGGRAELVHGRVIHMTPVGGLHAYRASRLVEELAAFVRKHELGYVVVEAGFILSRSPDTVLAPDVAIVDKALAPDGLPRGFVEGAPALAVEVTSPNDLDSEVDTKVRTYLEAGVSRVWVVREETQTVAVYYPDKVGRWFGIEDTLGSNEAGLAEEGLDLKVRDVFGP